MQGALLQFVSELYRRHLILVYFALATAKPDGGFKPTPSVWVLAVNAACATSSSAETLQATQKANIETQGFSKSLMDRNAGGYATA